MLFLEEIGADSLGFFKSFFLTPGLDIGVVAGEKNFWYFPVIVIFWAGVLGKIKGGPAEGFLCGGFWVEDTGKETSNGINDDHGRNFAAGEDIITNTHFFVDEVFSDALVEAFVMAGDQDKVVKFTQLLRNRLCKRFTLRREEDDVRFFCF